MSNIYLYCCTCPQSQFINIVENPDVVLWVQGRADNPTRRAIIREQLINSRNWPKDIRVSAFFMIGTPKNATMQQRLGYEFELYKDLVQNNYKGE